MHLFLWLMSSLLPKGFLNYSLQLFYITELNAEVLSYFTLTFFGFNHITEFSSIFSVVIRTPMIVFKFQDSLLLCQRKCEDALYSLLVLGARRPVRHLGSVAMAKIILKGDGISIYSRASSLQGFLADGKKNEAQKVAGLYTFSSLYIIEFY